MFTPEETCFLIGHITVELTTKDPNNYIGKIFEAGKDGATVDKTKMDELANEPAQPLDPMLKQYLQMLHVILKKLQDFAAQNGIDCKQLGEDAAMQHIKNLGL
jgi:hypothetical protein